MRFILILILSAIQLPLIAQQVNFGNKATVYLVRHAEKGQGKDPVLTIEGNKRAGDLMRLLKNKKIARIYVTEFKRTQNTGDSLRIQLDIDTVHYAADSSQANVLLDKIKANGDTNRSILIIGHSNTVPHLIRALGLPVFPFGDLPDNEFDNIFVLKFKDGKASVKKTKYGSLSTGAAILY
ncbi:MAG: histidine phosphatase family protein [Ferruginibacter sp.]